MVKSLTLEQRCTGDNIAEMVKNLRMDPPYQTGSELKKLIKLLSKDKCPPALLIKVALNPNVSAQTIQMLRLDLDEIVKLAALTNPKIL